ncbi:glycosyltransferase family 4 protein [Actinoplanes sp. NBC_00393]|uniref:glycosyltransferase family 4 protein n=1 Tax=Actinoplanes sp. NBC_00393 TaxID=2975953 RepID=UPI002E1C0F2E
MRVVLATDARTAGGVGRHLRDLATGLVSRGLDVRLAAPKGSRVAGIAAGIGAEFTAFEDGVERADIWHLHLADTYHRQSVRLLGLARVSSRRVIVTEHLPRSNASDDTLTNDPRTPGAATAKTAFKRLQLGLAHSVIAVSEASRRFLIERYGLSPHRIITIHNGIDIERFRFEAAEVRPAGRPVVVSAGALIRQKGHDVLIEATARSQRNWTAVIAGSGPQLDSLRSLAGQVAPDRVEFRGWVDDVPRLMRKASVVCLPSRWESFAYVVLEAMALATPLVATRVDGVCELITDERSGLLVDRDDPVALAAAIDRSIDGGPSVDEMTANALQDVRGFHLDTMVDKTLTHYRRSLGRLAMSGGC